MVRKNEEKAKENKSIWKNIQALEIFLCLVDGKPRSQKEIIEETGYWQGRISEILNEMRNADLVSIVGRPKIPKRGKPIDLWAIDKKVVESIFSRIIFYQNPKFAKGSTTSVKRYKLLPKLVMQYLRIVARTPKWRSTKWFENHIDELHREASKKEKEEQIVAYRANMPSMRPTEFNLQGVAEQFIGYLWENKDESKFTEEHKKEMMRLLDSYLKPNDSRDLRDVELSGRKGRLTITDKK